MAAALKSYRNELSESLSRLDKVAATMEESESDAGSLTKSKIASLQLKADDLNRTIDDICNEVNIERELKAANALREERASIKKTALEEETAAQEKYTSAKAAIEKDIAMDRSLRRQKLEDQELKNLRLEMDLRREARERADVLYSTDLSSTLRRLRERELDLERLHQSVSGSYERRRLYDALRRIRVGRLSLSEQILDYDYRSARLSRVLDTPALYDGLATRYYSTAVYPSPYYRYPYLGYPHTYRYYL
eukprot:m.18581 g.18581  ORF g.18581 m.18581 type:complete len:250 (+) comp12092_c0_seq1:155-904(+)